MIHIFIAYTIDEESQRNNALGEFQSKLGADTNDNATVCKSLKRHKSERYEENIWRGNAKRRTEFLSSIVADSKKSADS